MKYRYWVLAGAMAQASVTHGMGLGELDMQSNLGAPFQAQIDLISPREFDQNEIQVRIARLDIYNRFGAHFEAFHSNIEFSVQRDADGGISVHASSRKRMAEPFLDIVVELSWPDGTAYRRYNVLVDPPAYAARWNKAKSESRSGPIEPAALQLARQQVTQASAAVSRIPVRSEMRPSDEQDYIVQRGDSLWKVARQFQRHSGGSLQTAMDELYSANPDAFMQGDRNRLKMGARLQWPGALDLPAAQNRQQIAARKSVQPSLGRKPEPQPQRQAEVASVTLNPERDIHAELVQAEQAESVLPGTAADIAAELARLQQEKADLYAFQLQIKDEMTALLQQRIAVMEAMQTATKMQVQLKHENEAVATVSSAEPTPLVAQEATSTPLPAMKKSPPESIIQGSVNRDLRPHQPVSLASAAVAKEQAPTAKPNAELTLKSMLALHQTESPMLDVASVVSAQDLLHPTPVLSNRLISGSGPSLWYLVAMLPLGLLIVLMGMRAQRVKVVRESQQVKDENLHELVFGSRRDRNRSDSPDQIRQALTQIREKADYNGKQRESELEQSENMEGRDDLKQMIDLYIVYSQYQKALNVILTEISKRPTRADLRLYLMQVYASMGDRKLFDEQLLILQQMGKQQLVDEALKLRETIPQQPR